MKYSLSFLATLCLFIVALGFSSCQDDDADPFPTTGTIKGSFETANSLVSITATNAAGQVKGAFINNTDRTFRIGDLEAGPYTVQITPINGYVVPAARSVTVEAGLTADMGEIRLILPLVTGSVRVRIQPAGAATLVRLTTPTAQLLTATPDAVGECLFSNVPAGQALVGATPAAGYAAPTPQSVTIIGNSTSNCTLNVSLQGGSIGGQFAQGGAILQLQVTNPTTSFTQTYFPGSSASFNLTGLAPGTYRIRFTATGQYLTPADRTVTVTAAQTANLGTITVTPSGTPLPPPVVAYRMNGINIPITTVSAALPPGYFSLEVSDATSRLNLLVDNINGTGTYPLTGWLTTATYTLTAAYGIQAYPATSGSLVITRINTANRTVSGTFSFQAGTTVAITNGVFTDVPYR